MNKQESNPILGIMFMLFNALAISILYAIAKTLSKEISSNLTLFLYKSLILLLILPWCFKDGLKSLKTNHIFLHLSRGFLSIFGSICLYYAIAHIELVNITAVGYLEQVVLVLIGILYFKEKATFAKIAGIVISFFGAILVVYPSLVHFKTFGLPVFFNEVSTQSINPYYIFVFLSIGFWASNCIVIKLLGKTETTKAQLFYVSFFSSVIVFPLAFCRWEEYTTLATLPIKYPVEFLNVTKLGLKWEHLRYVLMLAVCYFVHNVCFFKALKYADLSTVIPFDYSRLVFTGLLGYLFFKEIPVLGAYVGYGLIVCSGIYIIKSESNRRKRLKEAEKIELEAEYEHS